MRMLCNHKVLKEEYEKQYRTTYTEISKLLIYVCLYTSISLSSSHCRAPEGRVTF